MPLRDGNFWLQNVFGRKICRNWSMRGGILLTSTEAVHRPRSNSPLNFDMRNIWQIRTQTWNASARCLLSADMLKHLPQVYRVKITFALLPTNGLVSTRMNSKKCLVNWILLRIRVRSRNTQPLSFFMKDNLRYSLSHLQWVANDIFKSSQQKPNEPQFVNLCSLKRGKRVLRALASSFALSFSKCHYKCDGMYHIRSWNNVGCELWPGVVGDWRIGVRAPRVWTSARNKISQISSWQKCFSELKISNTRISRSFNTARKSSWKVVWVTKWSYASETSIK